MQNFRPSISDTIKIVFSYLRHVYRATCSILIVHYVHLLTGEVSVLLFLHYWANQHGRCWAYCTDYMKHYLTKPSWRRTVLSCVSVCHFSSIFIVSIYKAFEVRPLPFRHIFASYSLLYTECSGRKGHFFRGCLRAKNKKNI